ncbi:MAG: hypothetical protein EOO71_32550 [Myxococcaceae bacterium]|nr:MAG: hypothetical protein EOO71_32550 [Myxococcaceae bacterium]
MPKLPWLTGVGLLWMALGCGPMDPGEELSASVPSTATSVEDCRNACAVGYVRCAVICNSGPVSNPTCKPKCTAALETCFAACVL